DENTQYNLLHSLYACPHGVFAMSFKLEGLVETSTNLASVKFLDNEKIEVVTSQRSSIDSSKIDIANMVASVFTLAGARVKHSDGYPGWAPDPNSEILKIAADSYERLFGKRPVVRAIHAGLECGLFLEKYPDLDMISFGPTLRGVHSPDERIDIETVEKWWTHLLDILQNIPTAQELMNLKRIINMPGNAKMYSGLLIVIFILLLTDSKAQDRKFSLGVKGGPNVSTYLGDLHGSNAVISYHVGIYSRFYKSNST
ncbi:MAG: hypothetical protein C0594_08940, partial [Marinilabiliales bacterium]